MSRRTRKKMQHKPKSQVVANDTPVLFSEETQLIKKDLIQSLSVCAILLAAILGIYMMG